MAIDVNSSVDRAEYSNMAVTAGVAPSAVGPVTSTVYDGSDRVTSYTQGGVTFTCTYYSSGNGSGKLESITGNGRTRTFLYNASGLLTDEVWS